MILNSFLRGDGGCPVFGWCEHDVSFPGLSSAWVGMYGVAFRGTVVLVHGKIPISKKKVINIHALNRGKLNHVRDINT